MEPRERYQPEDIEVLLHERGFDELLAEERAFVLRHLSGRTEYEAMRALLLRTRDDRTITAHADADPHVRAHLMDVFRAEQRPQWRIWLNSAGAWLLPKDLVGLWRPALAFGTVAAAVWFTIQGTHRVQEGHPQLAEVKVTPEKSTESASPEKVITSQPERTASTAPIGPVEEQGWTSAADEAQAVTAHPNTVLEESEVAKAEVAQPPPALFDAVAVTEDLAAIKTVTATGALDSVRNVDDVAVHEVTPSELARNMTSADMSEVRTVQREARTRAMAIAEKKARTKDRSFAKEAADDGEATASTEAGAYVGLLRAAW